MLVLYSIVFEEFQGGVKLPVVGVVVECRRLLVVDSVVLGEQLVANCNAGYLVDGLRSMISRYLLRGLPTNCTLYEVTMEIIE